MNAKNNGLWAITKAAKLNARILFLAIIEILLTVSCYAATEHGIAFNYFAIMKSILIFLIPSHIFERLSNHYKVISTMPLRSKDVINSAFTIIGLLVFVDFLAGGITLIVLKKAVYLPCHILINALVLIFLYVHLGFYGSKEMEITPFNISKIVITIVFSIFIIVANMVLSQLISREMLTGRAPLLFIIPAAVLFAAAMISKRKILKDYSAKIRCEN